ncbi:DnaD domain protein [Bacillus sp. REN16]|uniref:DnaD domain protein n=1 Tax=Bacillus sp. REN16 TaxID=2887296 RepID=UPI001E47AE6C|nr:DnaD domain protein [Bacillus sp. REN16]MCC3358200.1 DnaD domain protein [Bacillus sp. REN16]
MAAFELQRSENIRQERKWVYITYDELARQMQISKSTIRRAILKLKNNGFLASGNFNKLKIDRTNWYSINYEKVDELKADDNESQHEVEEKTEIPQPDLEESMCPNGADDVLKVDSPSAQNEQAKCSKWTDDVPNMNTAIPEITSEITTESTSETSSSKNKGEKEDENDAFQFFEQNGFGKIGNYYAKRIKSWCAALSGELVIESMKLALENGSNRWNYAEAVLKDWSNKGYHTVREIQEARQTYKRQKQKKTYTTPVRKELIPEWLHDDHQPDKPVIDLDFEAKKRLFEERLLGQRERLLSQV